MSNQEFDRHGTQEETALPEDEYSFLLLCDALIFTLDHYLKEHESERLSCFVAAIKKYLDNFAKGTNPENPENVFSFGFDLESGSYEDFHEIAYIDFYFESNMIEVSSGGSVYDKAVGSDSYTNWIYTIWLDGDVEGSQYSEGFYSIFELVKLGAKLRIESPEEFADDIEDE